MIDDTRFTDAARAALVRAEEEARRFYHNYIGTEHLLLGLLGNGGSVAARVLSDLGLEQTKVRGALEFIIGRGERTVVGEVGLTPRARVVIRLAQDETVRLGGNVIGTEHLLLGLIREGEGIASGVLESLGVDLERVRAVTLRAVEQGAVDQSGSPPTPTATPPGFRERELRWEYREIDVVRRGLVAHIRAIDKREIPLLETIPISVPYALDALGRAGWELVGIQSGVSHAEMVVGFSIYVFRREVGG